MPGEVQEQNGYDGWVKSQREPSEDKHTEPQADASPAGNWTVSKAGVHGKMKLSVQSSPSHGPLRVPECRGLWNVLVAVGSQAEIGNVSVN